ncbi:MAG: hypothetical protein JWN57_2670, partial [Frankiales bacterium]|nr:hypothetical protein [Frankiales bacterium]
MQRQDKDLPFDAVRGLVTDRRTVLKATGAAGIAAFLAACGSGSGSGSKGATGDAVGQSDTTGDEDVDFVRKTFVTDPKTAGAGIDMPIGAALLLSTSQAPYGQASLRGMELAAKQIKAAGGPNISFNVKDIAVST